MKSRCSPSLKPRLHPKVKQAIIDPPLFAFLLDNGNQNKVQKFEKVVTYQKHGLGNVLKSRLSKRLKFDHNSFTLNPWPLYKDENMQATPSAQSIKCKSTAVTARSFSMLLHNSNCVLSHLLCYQKEAARFLTTRYAKYYICNCQTRSNSNCETKS